MAKRQLNVRVEEQVVVDARVLALRSKVPFPEVVERLLKAYVDGKFNVSRRDENQNGNVVSE